MDLLGLRWATVPGSVYLAAVIGTFPGLLISVAVHEVLAAQTSSTFLRFPMLLLCGLSIPVSELPVFLRPLSFALPLTYGADIPKTRLNGNGILPLWLSFPVLHAFGVLLFTLSLHNARRKWLLQASLRPGPRTPSRSVAG